MAKEKKNSRTYVNFWAFLQNVLIHSINKGQFPLACVSGIIALIIWRMPPEFSAKLLDRILFNLTTWKGASYILNFTIPTAWAYHARWQRRSISSEIDRIGREKTQLQEQITGLKLSPSKKS
jgi:hypothetical protein